MSLSPSAAARPRATANVTANPTPVNTKARMKINEIGDHPYSTADTRIACGRESSPTPRITSL